MPPTVDDCWDVFGSDGEGDAAPDDSAVQAIVSRLAQVFLKTNSQISLSQRTVGVEEDSDAVVSALRLRGMIAIRDVRPGESESMLDLDAVVVMRDGVKIAPLLRALLPGGLLITCDECRVDEKHFFRPEIIYSSEELQVWESLKRPIHVHASKCNWLPSSHSLHEEERLLMKATICPSVHECRTAQLTTSSIEKAVNCLNEFGYCVIRRLLDPGQCEEWGRAVLQSVQTAAKILLERDQVDIYHPHSSRFEPQAYKELSMREDLRFDLRHGPQLASLRERGVNGNAAIVVSGRESGFDGFLRGDANLLEIIRRVMNPKRDNLFKGNIGRFNFEGTGPDGSFQDLRMSSVGGIVTLAGCADQAIHADTPHLFEHIADLPAHYINVFAPGTPFHQDLGGTAFAHGSHSLEFTAKYCGSGEGYQSVYPHLVRPSMDLGDVVLFDCRILHFGMSNTSVSSERVLLYTNTTQAWFQDPKNWDDRQSIFQTPPSE